MDNKKLILLVKLLAFKLHDLEEYIKHIRNLLLLEHDIELPFNYHHDFQTHEAMDKYLKDLVEEFSEELLEEFLPIMD